MAKNQEAPSCTCGKHLYRRVDNGKVRITDKFVWCRNQKCPKYNIPQGKTRFKPIAQVKIFDAPKATDVDQVIANVFADLAPKPQAIESAAVQTARKRIRDAIAAVEQTYSRSLIGLALAIVAQEMGSFDVANMLIAEYNLEKGYGILPRNK